MMQNEKTITFDKLPEAVGYLTEQVIELKIYTLVRKGILPAYKKGKKLYFYEDELLAWVENGRKKTSEQNYDEVLANMQSGMRRKPKPRTNF